MAQLVNRGLDACGFTIRAPCFANHTVIQWQRTPTIARISAKDRSGSDPTVFEMTAQESNTLWGGCKQHGALPLPEALDANLLIVLREIDITVLYGESLTHSHPRCIEQGEEGAIAQVGRGNGEDQSARRRPA